MSSPRSRAILLTVVGFVVLLCVFSAPATAETVKLCVNTSADYGDQNLGEDFWNDQGRRAKRYRGGYAEIAFFDGVLFQPLWDGYLGSGSSDLGCTPVLDLGGFSNERTYRVTLWTYGQFDNGTRFRVYDATDPSPWGKWRSFDTVDVPPGPLADGGTFEFTALPSTDKLRAMFRVANAAAFSLWRHDGGVPRTFYLIAPWDNSQLNATHRADHGAGPLWHVDILDSVSTSKYRIAHELEHLVGELAVGHFNSMETLGNGAQCNETASTIPFLQSFDSGLDDDPRCIQPTGHSPNAEEWSSCALSEGFANFFAASAWNDANQTDCWYALNNWRGCSDDTDCLCDGVACAAGSGVCAGNLCKAETCIQDSDCQCGSSGGGARCANGGHAECRQGFCENPRYDCDETCIDVNGAVRPECSFGSNYPILPLPALSICSVEVFGEGNETDWLRALWDMHAQGVSFNEIIGWLDTNTWQRDDAYSVNDASAALQSSALEAAWDAAKVTHALDREFGSAFAACIDGIDNDGDGLMDLAADPGCANSFDTSERSSGLPCDNGLDDDGDGLYDFGEDLDGDGISDLPGDPGCLSPEATREDPECSDGIDNDGDGRIDWNGALFDLQCTAPWHDDEAIPLPAPSSLIGVLSGVALLAARQRRCAPGSRRRGRDALSCSGSSWYLR